MAAPPITERHLHHFHRRSPIKESVRVATTANITIATALNNGDTLDGITLATDDRVLVKDQSSGAQNGIYIVGATPVRAYDQSADDPAFGFLVYVREGTAGGGKLYRNTNTSTPTIDTTALTFAVASSGVTSVAVTVPAEFSVSGSPITSSGTIAISKANESANTVWAGPTTGSPAAPTFRALVVADIPAGVGTHYEPLTSGDNSAPELMFTADGRCVMVPVSD